MNQTNNEASKLAGEMLTHIQLEGSNYGNWYVGITNNVRARLFDYHGVREGNSWYIYRVATSESVSRSVEKYLLNLGCDGGDGGGGYASRMIYAYLKTLYTTER